MKEETKKSAKRTGVMALIVAVLPIGLEAIINGNTLPGSLIVASSVIMMILHVRYDMEKISITVSQAENIAQRLIDDDKNESGDN